MPESNFDFYATLLELNNKVHDMALLVNKGRLPLFITKEDHARFTENVRNLNRRAGQLQADIETALEDIDRVRRHIETQSSNDE